MTTQAPVQTRALKPAEEIRQNLERMKPQFQAALPTHIDPSKFLRVVQTAVASSKDILGADRTSLFAACSKAAADGLLPDGREAALVVFKSKNGPSQVQYMPMIGGILKKIRNSGELSTITSQVIHKGDTFEYYIDHEGEHFTHRPLFFGERGEAIGAYALARTKDGAIYIEVMTKEQIMSVKKVSRGQSGPWSGDFESEMWRKTVTRRLAKRLPSSSDLDLTFKNDDELYDFGDEDGSSQTAEAKPAPKAKAKGLRVSQLIKKEEPAPQVTPEPEAQPEPEGEVVDADYREVDDAELPPKEMVDEELPI